MSAAEWAVEYITKLGVALVPIPPGSKGPRGKGWNQPGNYITEPSRARDFWNERPDFGMGAVLGPSRIVTLDIDSVDDTRLLFQVIGLDYDTLFEGAPRLQGNPLRDKYVFRSPVGTTLSRHALIWPAKDPGGKPITVFEMRAGDVQDCLPPTIHPETKRPYQWIVPPKNGFPELPVALYNIWVNFDRLRSRLQSACPWTAQPGPGPHKERGPSDGQGVIDEFNARHDIEAILKQHGYKKKGHRYLAPQSSSGLPGVVIFEDGKTCFSHHTADLLADGHAHDAFDVYRLLEHGGDFRKAVKSAADSMGFKQGQGHKAKVHRMADYREDEAPPEDAPPSEDWRTLITRNNRGRPYADLSNVELVLSHDPRWDGVLRLNQFSIAVVKVKLPPFDCAERGEWTDLDDTKTAIWLTRHYDLRVDPKMVGAAIKVVAERSAFHPVREYLASLEWDQKPRVPTWLIKYLGAADTPYHRLIGRLWLTAAIARVMQPGCKADNVLILEGAQGIGKSRALATLTGQEWFTDTPFELGHKDGFLAMRGKWVIELAELDSFSRAESSKAKYFFAASVDTYREPYARRTIDIPRQCVFAGSVNHAQYLRDETGNRRYWPILCGAINHALLGRDRDQLWAEAFNLYQGGEKWWLEETLDYVQQEQEQRFIDDAWEPRITGFLNKVLPIGGEIRVTTAEVLETALEKPAGQWTYQDQRRVCAILARLGFSQKPVRGPDGRLIKMHVRGPPDQKTGNKG